MSHYTNQEEADTKCSMIVSVYISHRDNSDGNTLVYCLLDSQSDSSFVRSDVVKSLGLMPDMLNCHVVVVYPLPWPVLVGESDLPACGTPACFSVHLPSSAVTPAGSVHKS